MPKLDLSPQVGLTPRRAVRTEHMPQPHVQPVKPEDVRDLALAVVAADRFPYLASIDGDQPRLRPVSPVRTEGFTVYVANLRNYHKTVEIAANPKVELCYLDLRIGRDFDRLVIIAQIGDVNREPLGPHGRHRPQARLIAVDAGEIRKPIGCDDGESEIAHIFGLHGLNMWLRHVFGPHGTSRRQPDLRG